MNAQRASILIFGRDLFLLDIRRRLLEAQGYEVGTVADLDALKTAVSEHKAELLILCHSLSLVDDWQAIAVSRECHPGMKLLFLTTETRINPTPDEAEVVSTSYGPAALLSKVKKMMGQKGVGGWQPQVIGAES